MATMSLSPLRRRMIEDITHAHTAVRLKAEEKTEIAEHAEIPDEEWVIAVKFFREYGVWRDHLGPPPGQSGCRVPLDVLEQYGFGKAGYSCPRRLSQCPLVRVRAEPVRIAAARWRTRPAATQDELSRMAPGAARQGSPGPNLLQKSAGSLRSAFQPRWSALQKRMGPPKRQHTSSRTSPEASRMHCAGGPL
jgi:hypothetical protein